MNRHACRPSAPSSTRAILDRVNVRTIGLIDRLVAIAVTTTIAAAPRRLLAGRVGDGFWRWIQRGIRYQRVESMARVLST